MEPLRFLMDKLGLNLKQKLFEDKQQTTTFQELFSLTKWIKQGLTLITQLEQLDQDLELK